MAKYLYGYHEERGFADLYVTDVNGNTVWEVHYPSFYESNGEMLEDTTVFEDGFMKNADDIEGLEKYLKSISVINRGDELVDRDEDMYDDDEDEYAAGGTIEAKIKKRLKNAFELPIQIAVYVPSTRDKDIIITKREMEARVDEVERFLANAFGGFSAVKVEGGFESSDKGLIQEDAVRVVAFASKENENGVPFEQSFESLMNQVKNWCYKWSQQSIGVEFENDLFYVDTETKFADGGYMAKGGEVDLYPYKDIQNLNMLYKSGSKWYAWGKKYNVETKGEGYTKKEALQDLDNHLSYVSEDDEFARGGKTYEYETYHNTLSSALNEADKYVESKGLKFTDETYFPDVTMGGISYGQTARLTRGIQREGKKKEDVLIVVIYRMDSGKYELTMYTSYEKGGYMADGGKVPSKKEMLDYLKMYFKHFSELRTIAVEEDGILTLKMLPTLDDEQIEMAYEDAKYELGEILKYENYADGGDIAESNLQMLRSNAKAIKHHAEELEGELNDDTEVEAWVVAKGERAATDLSDITHYLDGKKFYAGGLTAGRWYKDNSGEEFKYIGKNDDTGELIFTDGSKRVNKTLDDFGGRPKENKLFGFFEDGGDLEEGVDLFEDYDEMPASVVETLSKYDLESGDYRELEKALKDLKKYGYTFEYELDGQPYDLRKIGQKGKSEFYAKGGSIKSIEKRVAEVNELIKRGNELGIEVVDEGNTWQAPMKYKPLKYTNGVLYISYEVMDLYKYNREYVQDWEKKSYKIGRYESSWGHQGEEGSAQREALTEIARMYRKPLKSYDTYGYFEDGGEVNKVNPEEIKVKIEQILDKVVPSFYKGVSIHKNIFDTGNNIRIFIAASDYKINGVSGQLPQVVSLSLDLSDMDLHPQVYGGNGGQRVERKPNMSDPKEKYLAMKGVKVPFRTPQPNEKAVLDAIKRFAENYKKTLAENREVLLYQDIVDYDKLLEGSQYEDGGMMAKGGETKKYTDKLIEYLKKNGQLNQGRESIAQDGTKYRYDRYSTKGESANNWIVSLFENAAQENGNRYATEFSYKDIYSIAYDRPKYNNVVNGKISITELVELDKMAKGGEITPALNEKVVSRTLEILESKGNNVTKKDFDEAYDKAIVEFGYNPKTFKKIMSKIGAESMDDDYMADGGKVDYWGDIDAKAREKYKPIGINSDAEKEVSAFKYGFIWGKSQKKYDRDLAENEGIKKYKPVGFSNVDRKQAVAFWEGAKFAHSEEGQKMADGGETDWGADLGGGFSIGNDVYITDSKSLFQGKTGFVSGSVGRDLLVTIMDNGNERNVIVSKKGVEKLDAPEYAKGGVIASSTTKEGIEKLIGDYYYSKNISLKKLDDKDEYEVSNSKGKINGVKVIVKKGRYQFVESDKMAKGGTFAAGVKAIEKRLVGTKVNPKYQKEYGKTYDKAEAHEAASKIKGKMRAMELANKYKKKKLADGGLISEKPEYINLQELEDKAHRASYRAKNYYQWLDTTGHKYMDRWNKIVLRLRGWNQYSLVQDRVSKPEWIQYCKERNINENYNFGDVLG